ncbi:ETX/MTX2 family pore-forming toxin [Enterococcus faecalis]|uniref:ETX/MTX2 family pore-forming toxin n=1 Tax=Enterococcus faecalis TaxID=1351 RepID=UPI0034CF3BD6
MRSKLFLCVSVIGGSLFMFGNTKSVDAATITKIEDNLNLIGKFYYQNELQGSLKNGMYKLNKQPNSISSRATIYYSPDSSSFNLQKRSSDLIYIGDNEFNNTTDNEQKYVTTNFSKKVTNSTSTSTTTGFSINGTGLEFKLPFFIGGNKISATFNSNTTNTTNEADEETLTSGAQTVAVPAHKKYKVTTSLEQIKFEGTVKYKATGKDLQNQINATGMWIDRTGNPYLKKFDLSYSIGQEWNHLNSNQKNSIKELTIDPSNNTMTVDGEAMLTGVTGTKMIVKTYDVTNGQDSLVKTTAVKLY